MQPIRAFLRHNRRLALGVVVLALLIKTLIPAGYMLSDQSHVLTVTICGDASGQTMTKQIAVPAADGDHAKGEVKCVWGLLAMAALGGADLALLAGALAFILALGLAPSRPAPPSRRFHLRPPLRGPPAFA